MSEFNAGAAEVVGTPPLGVSMTGFGGRPSGCVDIRDDIFARALVLDDESTRIVLVTLDVLTLDADLVARVRSLVHAQTGIPASGMLLNYSHTHAGPAVATLRGLGERDECYCDVLVRTIAGCVKMANDRLQPARIGFAREPAQIGINRRQRLIEEHRTIIGQNPEGPVCKYVDVMKITSQNREPIACFFSHATHPVVLGADNLSISADWVGVACRQLSHWLHVSPTHQLTSSPLIPLFAQGCCGNINPQPRGTYEIAQQLGSSVASAVLKAWYQCETTDAVSIASDLTIVQTPLQDPPPVQQCEQMVNDWQKQLDDIKTKTDNRGQIMLREGGVAWSKSLLELARAGMRNHTLPYEIFGLRINDTSVIALAGEAFIELAHDIESRSPFPHTFVLGYSNGLPDGNPGWNGRGAVGYLPDAKSFPEGGYEVDVAIRYYGNLMFAPAAAQVVCDNAVELLSSLRASRHA